MDRQSIVIYLSLKDLNAVEVHNDLVTTLKGEARSSGIVTYHSASRVSRAQRHPRVLRVQLQSSTNRMKQSCWLYLKSLSRRCGSLCPEPTYTLPRSTTTSRTNSGSPFDIFVGSHIFCPKLTGTPEHKYHLNHSTCSSTRKTGRGMIL
jgi:hypothetical protein